jgi:hypothetical protein
MSKYALTDFSTNYSDVYQECAQAHTNMLMPIENKNIHDYNFYMLSALKENINYSSYIYVFAAGGLLSALLFSREGLNVRQVIFVFSDADQKIQCWHSISDTEASQQT